MLVAWRPLRPPSWGGTIDRPANGHRDRVKLEGGTDGTDTADRMRRDPPAAIPDAPATTLDAAVDTPQAEDRASFRPARGPSKPFIIALLLGILGVLVFALAASALFIFGMGIALAFFLVPVVNRQERRGMQRWIAAIVTVVVTLLAMIVFVAVIAVIVVNQGIQFVQELPTHLDDLGTTYRDLDLPDWLRSGTDTIIAAAQDNLASVDQGAIVAGLIGRTVNLIGGFFAWMLLPFFLFYLLKDQPTMSHTFYERVPLPWKDDVSKVLTITVGNFAQYFKAEFLVGSILFVMVTVGMIVIGLVTDAHLLVDFAILLGVIAFVMELLPQIGPIISYVPALILALASGPAAVIVVSVFYFVVFNIEGSILVPTFEGRMISFTGASVLALIAIGFALGGILGAILVLPLASIVRDVFRHFFDQAVQESLVLEPAPDTPAGAATSSG
jgi:predicted PurR-regulated permease PerM